MKRILIIEDDRSLVEGLKVSLSQEHFEVQVELTGECGIKRAKEEKSDLIILDLTLPDIDGMDVCRILRKEEIHTPLIMLTGRKDDLDKIIGFEIGADDYITKPFNSRELVARIKAILRRVDDYKNEDKKNYKFDDFEVDFKKMEVIKDKTRITLPLMELKILKYMIERIGEVVTREQLFDDVWGYDSFPTTRTVDNFILSLRKKIEENPAEPKHIITVFKAGYKFLE